MLSGNITTLNLTYIVTCHGPRNKTVTKTTNYTWLVFDKSDGIEPGSDYLCSVQTVEVVFNANAVNASGKVISRTSVDSQSVLQTTIEGKGMIDVIIWPDTQLLPLGGKNQIVSGITIFRSYSRPYQLVLSKRNLPADDPTPKFSAAPAPTFSAPLSSPPPSAV